MCRVLNKHRAGGHRRRDLHWARQQVGQSVPNWRRRRSYDRHREAARRLRDQHHLLRALDDLRGKDCCASARRRRATAICCYGSRTRPAKSASPGGSNGRTTQRLPNGLYLRRPFAPNRNANCFHERQVVKINEMPEDINRERREKRKTERPRGLKLPPGAWQIPYYPYTTAAPRYPNYITRRPKCHKTPPMTPAGQFSENKCLLDRVNATPPGITSSSKGGVQM